MEPNHFEIPTITREEVVHFLQNSREWEEEQLFTTNVGPMEDLMNPLSISDQGHVFPSEMEEPYQGFEAMQQLEIPLIAVNASSFSMLKASNAEKMLFQVESLARSIYDNMQQLLKAQKQVSLPIDPQAFLQLQTFQQAIQTDIETINRELNQLLDTTILSPKEFNTLHQFLIENQLLRRQLEVYKDELNGFSNPNSVPSFALAIISQPFPESVKQTVKIEDTLTVRMLTGAKNDFKPQCRVKGEIVVSPGSPKKAARNQPPIVVENVDKALNDHGVVHFDSIKFPNGTRLKGIRLKFYAQLNLPDKNGSMHPVTLESPASGAIVVKTNENQWGEAEGILIKKTAFEGKNEIHWYRLANWLQRRYILATRQNVSQPTRALTAHDFKYIHKNKFGKQLVINQTQFDNFWTWFGSILHKIRHQRFLAPLWIKGYICGFLARQEVQSVLEHERIGTFVIRFSENHDSFVISYQAEESDQLKVKHYLLKQDDTMGARKTLADFLREFRDLVVILQLRTEKDSEQRTLTRCDKDAALKEFYTRYKNQTPPLEGYEEDVHVRGGELF